MAGVRPRVAPEGTIRRPCPPAQEIEWSAPRLRSSANRRRRVVCWKAEIVAEVIDGLGFSTDDLRRRQQDGHVGLALLEERVADAEATFAITSAPGSGTSIRLLLARARGAGASAGVAIPIPV
jgi:hypothetical protein